MKVLMLLGLIVVTVWAYPVADSDNSASSSSVVAYSSKESSESDSSASSEVSSEESTPEVSNEAQREPEKIATLEINRDVEPLVNLKSVDQLPTEVVQDVPIPSPADIAPIIEQKTLLPETPLADKTEQAVEIQEAPIALPTLNTQASELKEEQLKADEPKVDVVVPAEEDIKLEASEVKTVEQPAIVIKEELPLVIAKDPIEQDVLPEVAIVPQAKSEQGIVVEPLPVQQSDIDSEKKERRDDIPIALPSEGVQQEPIQTEVELSKPELVAAPVADAAVPVGAQLTEEAASSINLEQIPSEEGLSVPTVLVAEKQVQADPIVPLPEASETLPVELPIAADKPEEIAAVIGSEERTKPSEGQTQPEQPADGALTDVRAAPIGSAEQSVEPQQQVRDEDAPVVAPQADVLAPTDPVIEAVQPAESEVSNNALKEAH